MGEVLKFEEIEAGQIYQKTESGERRIIRSIDAGVVMSLGEGCNLSLKAMIDLDLSSDKQAAVLRGLLRLGEVEKAQAELKAFEGLRVVQGRALTNAEKNVQNVALQYGKRLSEIEVEIGELEHETRETAERQEREFRASGRRGEFKRSPNQEKEVTALGLDIDTLKKERAKIHEDIEGNKQGLMQALANARLQLATTDEEIAKRRSILGLPPEETAE